jgi:carotenoid cleavage dioxygenase-like enzyme
LAQVFETESSFLIHHANAFEDGDEVEVWSSGWGPEALRKLDHTSGMLGSWRVVLSGDFTGIPYTALWRHRHAPQAHGIAVLRCFQP